MGGLYTMIKIRGFTTHFKENNGFFSCDTRIYVHLGIIKANRISQKAK